MATTPDCLRSLRWRWASGHSPPGGKLHGRRRPPAERPAGEGRGLREGPTELTRSSNRRAFLAVAATIRAGAKGGVGARPARTLVTNRCVGRNRSKDPPPTRPHPPTPPHRMATGCGVFGTRAGYW